MEQNQSKQIRILHIEDSDTDAYAVERALQQHPGKGSEKQACSYILKRVTTMREAEETLRDSDQWDIILLDLELPDTSDRTETFARLAALKADHIPALILTSVNDHQLAVSLVDDGAEDYVRKSAICRQPETLCEAIEFAICRHNNFNAMKDQKNKELEEKDQVIQWVTGSYSKMD